MNHKIKKGVGFFIIGFLLCGGISVDFLNIPIAFSAGTLASFSGNFTEDWETLSFITNDWIASGTVRTWNIATKEGPIDSYHAVARNTDGEAVLETGISTIGYQNINFNFYWSTDTRGLGEGEYYIVDWYNGTNWVNVLYFTGGTNTTYTSSNNILPPSANNNPNFRIRFRCNSSHPQEGCNVDDVNITGTFVNTPPVATVPSSISQYTDGNGYVSFQTTISDADLNETKLKVEYSDDGGSNWYDPDLASVQFSNGSVDMDDANVYQIGTVNGIDTDDYANITLTIVWDTKSASNGNGSLNGTDQSDIRVRITPNDGIVDGTSQASANFRVDDLSPTGLTALTFGATTSASQVLSWTAVTEANFNHYEIWYGTNQNDVQNRMGTALKWDETNDATLATRLTSTTTITGLNNGVKYFYKIWAVDNFGNSQTVTDINKITGTFGATINSLNLFYENGHPIFRIDYTLSETNSAECNFTTSSTQVQYSTSVVGPWTDAVIYGAITGIDSSTTGIAHTESLEPLYWDASGLLDGDYYLRLQPHNGTEYASEYALSTSAVSVYTPLMENLMRHEKFMIDGVTYYLTQ